jgi:hypothetical protein
MKKIFYLIVFFGIMIVLELGYLSIALDRRMNKLQQQQAYTQARLVQTEATLRRMVLSVQYFREQHRMKHEPCLLLALND